MGGCETMLSWRSVIRQRCSPLTTDVSLSLRYRHGSDTVPHAVGPSRIRWAFMTSKESFGVTVTANRVLIAPGWQKRYLFRTFWCSDCGWGSGCPTVSLVFHPPICPQSLVTWLWKRINIYPRSSFQYPNNKVAYGQRLGSGLCCQWHRFQFTCRM